MSGDTVSYIRSCFCEDSAHYYIEIYHILSQTIWLLLIASVWLINEISMCVYNHVSNVVSCALLARKIISKNFISNIFPRLEKYQLE